MSHSKKKVNGGGYAKTCPRAVRNWKKREASRYRRLVKESVRDVHDEETAQEVRTIMSPLKEAADPYGPRDGRGFRGTERQAELAGWHDTWEKELRK